MEICVMTDTEIFQDRSSATKSIKKVEGLCVNDNATSDTQIQLP